MTDIQPLNESDILPAGTGFAQTDASDNALGMLMKHAEVMGAAHKLAIALCGSELVPKIYRGKPDNGAAAILYGAELGLSPIQSMQQIFVVHGTPAIYARTMVALVKQRGYRIWTEESTDESVTVCGQAPDGTAEISTWTMDRARKAGYVPEVDPKTGKFKVNEYGKLIGNEKYLKDPQAMLYAKAASEVCRKLAPDVLLGISQTFEDLELDDQDAPKRVKSEQLRPQRGIAGLKAALAPAPVVDQEPTPESKPETAPEPEPTPEQPVVEYATRDQQNRIAELLDTAGVKTKTAKLEYLQGQFGDGIKSAADVTADQAAALITFLEQPDDPASA